jgi:hypothetical protein
MTLLTIGALFLSVSNILLFVYVYRKFIAYKIMLKTYLDCMHSLTNTEKTLMEVLQLHQKTIDKNIKDIVDLQLITGEISAFILREGEFSKENTPSFSDKKSKNKPN